MMRRAIMAVAFVGLVMLGVGVRSTADAADASCFLCLCVTLPPAPDMLIPTACSNSDINHIVCPECPPGSARAPERTLDTSCNEAPECRPFISRAPALSHIPLAGLGLLLVGGGVWLTRKRTRLAS